MTATRSSCAARTCSAATGNSPDATRASLDADGWFAHRRHWRVRPRRLPQHRRAQQGADHLRRVQRVPRENRGRAARSTGRGRRRGRRHPVGRVGRGGHRGRRRRRRAATATRSCSSRPASSRRSSDRATCASSTSCRATPWARSCATSSESRPQVQHEVKPASTRRVEPRCRRFALVLRRRRPGRAPRRGARSTRPCPPAPPRAGGR